MNRIAYFIYIILILVPYTSQSNPIGPVDYCQPKPLEGSPDQIPNFITRVKAIDSIEIISEKIHHAWEIVMLEGKFIKNLKKLNNISLPVAIGRKIGGQDFGIMIHGLSIRKDHANLEASMSLYEPFSGQKLAFYGDQIKLSNNGGLEGSGTLYLLEDIELKINYNLSLMLSGGRNGTSVAWDCDGYQYLHIKGQLVLNEQVYESANPDQPRVAADFKIQIASWDDFIVELQIEPFKLKGLDGFIFTVDNATLDFSDTRNPLLFSFNKTFSNQIDNLWRGILLNQASVTLPNQFKAKNTLSPPVLQLENSIIDANGLSGSARGSNLLPMKDGSMHGWPFGVDSLSINFSHNRLYQGYFDGQVSIPMISKNQPLAYKASISENHHYYFELLLQDSFTYKMPVFQGEINLSAGSSISVELRNQQFYPVAHLNGWMKIDAAITKNTSLKIERLAFGGMQLSTESPYFSVDHFGSNADYLTQKFGGFTLTIDEVQLKSSETKMGLQILSKINLVKDIDGGFGADAKFTIWGNVRHNEEGIRFFYDQTEVSRISLDFDQGILSLKGGIEFFKYDAIYGDGFSGQLYARFPPEIELNATALFGSKDNLRYWFADASAVFKKGLPIGGIISLNGFGGGAYYHMKQTSESISTAKTSTATGTAYIPDAETHFGVKASTCFGLSINQDLFNGIATLEVSINKNGGLGNIAFNGSANFLADPVSTALKEAISKNALIKTREPKASSGTSPQNKSAISANISLSYDFPGRILHGNFEAYVNFGGGLIKGVGQDGLAGQAVLHLDPDKWYFYLGDPINRVGLRFGTDEIAAVVSGYFMTGNLLPAAPDPPDYIYEIIGLKPGELSYTSDLNQINSGLGIAFGANFNLNTGKKTFLIFYGQFAAGAGFDIMLKKYDQNVICSNTNDNIGLNGWYANGQAYAYFQGDIGIEVVTTFFKGEYKILNIAAAAILQAKLPNPSWMRGAVGGKYNILGGLVKGDCNFEIELGKECELQQSNPLKDIEIIADLKPVDNEKQVSVFVSPQASFNLSIDKPYEFFDLEENLHSIRVSMEKFNLSSGHKSISGNLTWNEDKTSCSYIPNDILPGKETIEVEIILGFEEKINNQWIPVKINGQYLRESRKLKFQTDQAPDVIVADNIKFSYPIDRQLNLFHGHSDKGYVQLIKGQDYLFERPNWTYAVRYQDSYGSNVTSKLTYHPDKNLLQFAIPANLKPGNIYQLQFKASPPIEAKKLNQNLDTSYQETNLNADNVVKTRKNKLLQSIDGNTESTLYSLDFRNSLFTTIEEKLAAMLSENSFRFPVKSEVHRLGTLLNNLEDFDQFEMKGGKNHPPLIRLSADLSDNEYFRNFAEPVIYEGYPIDHCQLLSRDTTHLGLPPVNAIYLNSPNSQLILKDRDLLIKQLSKRVSTSGIVYDLAPIYHQDYEELRLLLAIKISNGKIISERGYKLINQTWKRIPEGNYEYIVQYYLPGAEKPVFNKKYTLNHEITILQ